MESQIIDYLKQVYSPKVIILAGSHATETNTDQSDWDLFLFCESEHSGGFFEWSGQLLDITIHNWPKSDDWVLTIPYGPLWPVKVLYDETNGVFDAILKRTKEKYDQGPLIAYPIGCAERLQKPIVGKEKLSAMSTILKSSFTMLGIFTNFWSEFGLNSKIFGHFHQP